MHTPKRMHSTNSPDSVSKRNGRRKRLEEQCYLGNQHHLLYFFKDLTPFEQEALMDKVESLNYRDLNLAFMLAYEQHTVGKQWAYQRPEILNCSTSIENPPLGAMARLKDVDAKVKAEWHARGLQMIANGKVGVVLLAGGQGTRLGFAGPKGCYGIGPISNMPLFQIFAQKMATLQQLAGDSSHGGHSGLQLYIMTGEHNDTETRKYFKDNDFGLEKSSIHFFQQPMNPCFDKRGKMLLEDIGVIAQSPNGNGGVFESLQSSGMFTQMKSCGVEALHVVGIDNALCKVADPTFLGFADTAQVEVANKCVEKVDPSEKVGVFCTKEPVTNETPKTTPKTSASPTPKMSTTPSPSNKSPNGSPPEAKGRRCCVVEYTELPKEFREARGKSKELQFSGGNICSHYFTVDFIKRMLTEKSLIRKYHVAEKKVKCINMEEVDPDFPVLHREYKEPEEPNAVKLELYVFDSFEFAKSCIALEVQREEEFAPVKNAEGEDSPATAIALTSRLHQKWLKDAGAVFDPPNAEASAEQSLRCEVSPLVSYEGEGLTGRVSKTPVKLPFHLKQ